MGDENSQTTPTPVKETKELIAHNGCLAFQLKSGKFKEMTNFVPTCVGYVKKSKYVDKAVGYLIKVAQKESKENEDGETDDVGNG